MIDNEIIKAWEKVLNNSDEPIGEHWMVFVTTQMAKETFDMLTRQKAEIVNRTEEYNDMLEQRNKVEEALEVMTMDVNSLTSERDALQEMVAEQKAEIERLRENNQKLYEEMAERQKEEVAIAKRMGKSEAYREFWMKLRTHGHKMMGSDWSGEFCAIAILVEDGDKLLIELTEK